MNKVAQMLKKVGAAFGAGCASIFRAFPRGAKGVKLASALMLLLLLGLGGLGWYWSREPLAFDVRASPALFKSTQGRNVVTGSVTTATLIQVGETLLDKPGGYLSNDRTPPSIFLDNMPNWEFGVLVQVRDLTRSLRNDLSRSRTQSLENPSLAAAEPLFNYDNNSWVLPASESQYREALSHLHTYIQGLSQQQNPDTQFYARADNLRDYLTIVEKRLGGLSQRLSASVGPTRVNIDLAGDPNAGQSTRPAVTRGHKTPWLELDDVFYEARGSTWALIHFLKAIEVDFADVLEDKNAKALLQQIILELEATQQPVWSPMILNGNGFGFFANHSLVMASYISRANAALIDMRALLTDG
ncbi:DUF2333 family protein [Acanthopleuribacter pedis]|uniref:DUF2333 family protein n=1 Tax=Acanthopleuribacter pedis TaxID=442870 RepID=A0A8J7Q3J5_9BACT|nr:DUF2333 family protein [Acanthopleuribacter pedis]MBO1316981.1 DUF2333 family protein [Acanthopleuribacter pedis]